MFITYISQPHSLIILLINQTPYIFKYNAPDAAPSYHLFWHTYAFRQQHKTKVLYITAEVWTASREEYLWTDAVNIYCLVHPQLSANNLCNYKVVYLLLHLSGLWVGVPKGLF